MADKPKDGGPAFPGSSTMKLVQNAGEETSHIEFKHGGMSLRDYFAGQALAGILATSDKNLRSHNFYEKEAVGFADALLAELEKNVEAEKARQS